MCEGEREPARVVNNGVRSEVRSRNMRNKLNSWVGVCHGNVLHMAGEVERMKESMEERKKERKHMKEGMNAGI